MSEERAIFDGLADIYEKYRPRYPYLIFKEIINWLPQSDRSLTLVDLGSGTGIVFEGLMPLMKGDHIYHAVDISGDMIAQGKKKYPEVHWHKKNQKTSLRT